MKYSIFSTICLFLFTFFYSCAQKNSNKDISGIDKKATVIIEDFFNDMKKGDYRLAISSLLKKNDFIDVKDSSAIYLLNKFYYINDVSGPFLGYQLIKSKKIENDVAV